ncbi:MAG: 5'-3' exonuclease H3TH domain-containing protein, partial [Elainella sp.]
MSATQLTLQPPKLLLVDGHSLAFRSYFAHAKGRDGGLRTSTGIPTSVSYGFTKSLLDTLEAEKPEYVVVAFDMGEPTFRHEADETYKAGRPDAPEDFLPDLQNLRGLLEALNIPMATAAGYEADDIIGTLARRATTAGWRVKVLSGDRDLFQLIDPNEQTTVLYLSTSFGKGTPPPKEFGIEQVKDKLGILPSQVVDYKALCGDSSDNIPGVRGIGDKTAVTLLTSYGSLEQVYASLDEIKGALRQKLEAGREDACRSQYMAQIHLDVPLDLSLEDCKLKGFDNEVLVPLLEKYEFRSFLNKINKLQQALGGEVAESSDTRDTASTTANQAADAKAQRPLPSFEDDDLSFFSAEETETSRQLEQAAIQPQIIDTAAKLSQLVDRLQGYTDAATPVAWDTETTALDPLDADLVGIGCCWGSGLADMAYIPLGHRHGDNLDQELVLTALRPILESDAYPKALQNAKYDRLVLRHHGVCLRGVVFDTMLASYVLNPEANHSLSDLGLRYLDLLSQSYTDLVPKGKNI